jgi:tricorn protease interacting factor F2/3
VLIERFDWELDLDYRAKTFSGTVRIHFEGSSPDLALDARDLTVTSSELDGRPTSFTADPEHYKLRFGAVSDGKHRLDLTYHGKVQEDSVSGLYESASGAEYVLTAMNYPSGLSRIVPCFDEPGVKAEFHLTLTADADVPVIFNTSEKSHKVENGKRRVEFLPTPPIASYLVYLGAGPFESVDRKIDGRRVIVAAPKGRAAAGAYAMERSFEILSEYEEYYRIPYPLDKLHLVALENFWAGAQENWGAITFRETVLLVDPTSSEAMRRSVLITLAHEIAHQWFGDLVTPVWWDDFWLNESFATFASYLIVDRLYPEEEPWRDFLLGQTSGGLDADALASAHPIQTPVRSAEDCGQIADAITYGKGASVLRMIEAYLGESAFRDGVSSYLTDHRYGNARGHDLWTALDAASEQPVSKILEPWLTRAGHPVVEAEWRDGHLEVRQRRYLQSGETTHGLWPIPLTWQVNGQAERRLFDGAHLKIPLVAPQGLRINPQRTGFYRVALRGTLLDQAFEEMLGWTPEDRWGFINDATSFVISGDLAIDRYIALLELGVRFDDPMSVRGLLYSLQSLAPALRHYPPYVEATRRFLTAQLDRIGVDPVAGESAPTKILRERLAFGLARTDDKFAARLAPRFASWDTVPAELRSSVAASFASTTGAPAFDQLVARLRSTTNDIERSHMVEGLAAFREPELQRRALDLIPGPGISPSRGFNLLLRLLSSRDAGEPVWHWITENLDRLSKLYEGSPILNMLFRDGLPFIGIDRPDEVRKFLAAHPVPEAERGIANGLEDLANLARLKARLPNPSGAA